MTSSSQKPITLSEASFAKVTRNLWLGWPSSRVGLLVMLMFLVPSLATIWNMHQRSRSILTDSIKTGLIASAQAMARVVDPDLHGRLKERSQEQGAEYQQQIARLSQMRGAIDPKAMIKFVYTCVKKGEDIYFVLDDTPEGDADHDGVDDKAHIMELYKDASAPLRKAFSASAAEVNDTPYSDKWGTFISGYAPIFDASHHVVAVAGVDLALADYELQMSSIRLVSLLSSIGALSLSIIAGLAMSKYHGRLQESISQLVTLSEAAMAAARAKTDFLASMSHELRTPMHAIIGHSGLLNESALSGPQRDSVEAIQRAADSLHGMVTDILDYAALDNSSLQLESKPMALRSFFDELKAPFANEATTKGLAFEISLDSSCPSSIISDRTRLRQILRHVISNAIKFTAKGSISVKVGINAQAELQVAVSDTGIGMSSEQRNNLFEVFGLGDASTTRAHGGAGIGLAIAGRICKAMRGRISVESEQGKGSTFRIEIPVELVPEPGDVWLVTSNNLTTILVRSVVEKLGRRLHLVSAFDQVEGGDRDLILVDVASATLGDPRGRKVIAINADEGVTLSDCYAEVLHSPVKPAALREALER